MKTFFKKTLLGINLAGILFLLIFLIAHLFGNEDNIEGAFSNFVSTMEFILFPCTVLLGLLLALKKQRLGGSIMLLSIFCIHLLRLDFSFMIWLDAFGLFGFILFISSLVQKKLVDND